MERTEEKITRSTSAQSRVFGVCVYFGECIF